MEPKKRLIKIMGFLREIILNTAGSLRKGAGLSESQEQDGEQGDSSQRPGGQLYGQCPAAQDCVIEWNDHGAWKTMKDICQAGSVKQADSADYRYKIFGVTYYMQGTPAYRRPVWVEYMTKS